MPNWKIEDVITYAKRKPVTLSGRYNPKIVVAFFKEHGVPPPQFEWNFFHERKWRFDIAWPEYDEGRGGRNLALEVQGGIWSAGAHNRGAAMLKEWEKLNEAAALGWRVIYCQPSDLCTLATAELIKRCLGL